MTRESRALAYGRLGRYLKKRWKMRKFKYMIVIPAVVTFRKCMLLRAIDMKVLILNERVHKTFIVPRIKSYTNNYFIMLIIFSKRFIIIWSTTRSDYYIGYTTLCWHSGKIRSEKVCIHWELSCTSHLQCPEKLRLDTQTSTCAWGISLSIKSFIKTICWCI